MSLESPSLHIVSSFLPLLSCSFFLENSFQVNWSFVSSSFPFLVYIHPTPESPELSHSGKRKKKRQKCLRFSFFKARKIAFPFCPVTIVHGKKKVFSFSDLPKRGLSPGSSFLLPRRKRTTLCGVFVYVYVFFIWPENAQRARVVSSLPSFICRLRGLEKPRLSSPLLLLTERKGRNGHRPA